MGPPPIAQPPLAEGSEIVNLQRRIAKLLKFSTFEPEQRHWLDTGSPELNAVFGARKQGIPYGKLSEISGLEHGGKTALCTILAGAAQRDGAAVGYVDLEDSRDSGWAAKLQLEFGSVLPIYPKLVRTGAKKDGLPRLQYAEELFDEAETGMHLLSKRYEKQVWIVDSIAHIQTQKVVDAGLPGQTMNTKVDRAVFLGNLLPRWAGLAANYNAMVLLINQLRARIGLVFGDPYDTPGGREIRHACAIRARVRRLKNGQMRNQGKVVGIIGIVKNIKNKAGGGSVEGETCGFSIRWDRTPAKIEFMTASDAEDLLKGERSA